MDTPGIHPNFEDDSDKRPVDFDDDSDDMSEEISFEDFERIDNLSRIHTDEDLERAVKDLLMHSNKVDALDITVDVDASNVTLSGTVHSQEERDYALSIVKLIQGVGDVHSSLVVKLNPGIHPSDIGRN